MQQMCTSTAIIRNAVKKRGGGRILLPLTGLSNVTITDTRQERKTTRTTMMGQGGRGEKKDDAGLITGRASRRQQVPTTGCGRLKSLSETPGGGRRRHTIVTTSCSIRP
ncbi:hypothetical protein GWI33_014611 [Rhynchophorus ferrugineus]|uniref:Uncharacterized protein n=1 Tax=Rhynchophorus ferrugineus TaxID=354439 RepID=A0A834I195_RHYFE|nr:hypothetical protein GWI33_014611 [Rhynchophorus ferrugineus]